MTREQWMAMGASADVAEALAKSDAALAAYRRELVRQIAERTEKEMLGE